MATSDLIRPNDHILFQGDSITNAFRMPEEICNSYQLGAGYAMMASAQLLAERVEDNLTITNRGVSGEGVAGLAARWQEDCLDLKPDVLSILVGINDCTDVSRHSDKLLASFDTHYRELLTRTKEALPEVKLVLAQPFVLDVADVLQKRAGARERAAIAKKIADDFGARWVPYQDMFDEALKRAPAEYWSFDGIHPNAQGHRLMADAWLKVVTGEG